METWETVLIIIGAIAILIAAVLIVKTILKDVNKVRHLNLYRRDLKEMPAVPFILTETVAAAVKLGLRAQENRMAKEGLNNMYTLGQQTRSSYTFLYADTEIDHAKKERDALIQYLTNTHEKAFLTQSTLTKKLAHAAHEKKLSSSNPLNEQFMEDPKQFTISWTNYGGLYHNSQSNITKYASIMTDPDQASEQFWPMIAEHGLAYNLLILEKVNIDKFQELKVMFNDALDEINPVLENDQLFALDLRIFSNWNASEVKNFDRWTPATYTLLKQDPITKKLTPIAVHVCAANNQKAQTYTRTNSNASTWIFALMAARTSVTVYGIWLGHVYHWHIVSASMQMTLFNEVKEAHPLRKLLDPQSKSLIGFDATLLLLWNKIGPPTSFSSPQLFLELTNTFAKGRNFFDDDPNIALERLGLQESDFTISEPWDQYPVVRDLLYFWNTAETFASEFVDHTYKNDREVFSDTELQNWMTQATNPTQGNVRGLPRMESKDDLKRVLSSLINRVVAHGNSRQLNSLDDALCFVANYPPCLQDIKIPEPGDTTIDLKALLRYLPNTGTIGEMMTFYYIFTYSAPYNPLIPLLGTKQDLYFDDPNDPRNAALIKFRTSIETFIRNYDVKAPMVHQWPASIET